MAVSASDADRECGEPDGRRGRWLDDGVRERASVAGCAPEETDASEEANADCAPGAKASAAEAEAAAAGARSSAAPSDATDLMVPGKKQLELYFQRAQTRRGRALVPLAPALSSVALVHAYRSVRFRGISRIVVRRSSSFERYVRLVGRCPSICSEYLHTTFAL